MQKNFIFPSLAICIFVGTTICLSGFFASSLSAHASATVLMFPPKKKKPSSPPTPPDCKKDDPRPACK